MNLSRIARISSVCLLALAASSSMSCGLLFDMERGELADSDSGAKADATSDTLPPKVDGGAPDGSDARVEGDGRSDTTIDSTPSDSNGDGPRADTGNDTPRPDAVNDGSPPADMAVDSNPPSDVITVDSAPDAPRDISSDPPIDAPGDAVDAGPVDAGPVDAPVDQGGCSPTSCPTGCCNGNTCVPYASQNNTSCGAAGAACAPCPANNTCTQTSSACQFQCNATSCPTGCCSNANTCVPYAGQNNTSCGTAGAACAPCPANNTCTQTSNTCQFQCNATSCPTGCCSNANTCVPYGSQNDNTCGTGGNACGGCSAGRTCSTSSGTCVTWCGARSAPAGVAASDYACLDFENGMPPTNVWVPSVQEMSSLEITNVALSLANGLQSLSYATQSLGNESLMRWASGVTTTKLKQVWVSAAVNPSPFQRIDSDFDVLCATMSTSFKSSVCLRYSSTDGLIVRWWWYNGSGYQEEICPAMGTISHGQWTNIEVRLDATTGLGQTIIGGTTTNCQALDLPLEDTVGGAQVGLDRSGAATFGMTMRYDNVEVSVRR